MPNFFDRMFGAAAAPKNETPSSGPPERLPAQASESVFRPKFPQMSAICLDREISWIVDDAPASALRVPSMMSTTERRALYNLASRRYRGFGVIIDAGIFLGASTCCFGEGLRANENLADITDAWPRPIIAFERGVINPNMPTFFDKNDVDISEGEGGSFVSEIKRNIARVADLVDLRIGDIIETSADIASPVEILFLDVLKLPQISKAALSKFFPLLIPGVSIVIQQDYFHDRLPFICVDQEFFRDYFEYLGEIGPSALFRCAKAIPQDAVDRFNAEIAPDEQSHLSSIAMRRSFDPARQFMVALSKVRLIYRTRGLEAAKSYFAHIQDDYPEQCALLRQPVAAADKFIASREEMRQKNRQIRDQKARQEDED